MSGACFGFPLELFILVREALGEAFKLALHTFTGVGLGFILFDSSVLYGTQMGTNTICLGLS